MYEIIVNTIFLRNKWYPNCDIVREREKIKKKKTKNKKTKKAKEKGLWNQTGKGIFFHIS